jgi:hypothetical protein
MIKAIAVLSGLICGVIVKFLNELPEEGTNGNHTNP